ncbi:MAG TPA: UDP-glucose/GDP-mannose dehydrogenase family protein [Acidobacteriota bacterium]
MNLAVVGSGYVGLVTGACFAEFGLNVTCIDSDADKIRQLNDGQVSIFEPGLEEMVRRNAGAERLNFTSDIRAGVERALVIFIAVGTPSHSNGAADLSYIDAVARSIGEAMDGYKVIVTKSTVPVGTGERIRRLIRQHQREPIDFDVASNPEFLREGSAIEDFMRPNRVVIGCRSPQAVAILKDLYRPLYLLETPVVVTTVESAELIKYASNAFLALKVAFINEVAAICEQVGADVQVVARGMGLDQRIGSKFLHPGPGFGGSCFPKDTRAFVAIGERAGIDFSILKAVLRANQAQKQRMVEKIERAVGGVDGKRIAILGLSFKPNTHDMREAPSIEIIAALQQKGARIRAYDPAAMEEAQRFLNDVEYAESAQAAAADADALVLLTEWNPFRSLDLAEIKSLLRQPILVDCKNVYDPEQMRKLGFHYTGIGRGEGISGA